MRRKSRYNFRYAVIRGKVTIFETNDWSFADFTAQNRKGIVIDKFSKKRCESTYNRKSQNQ